ncbi:MAG: hypothetical protein IKU82_00035, partial [Clostridia bacterium]|nr:hypothetical protein [Clostridia bacterium]
MKKLLSLILVVAVIVCAAPFGAFTLTANAYTSGYYEYYISDVQGGAVIEDVNISINGNVTVPSSLG